MNLRIGTDIDQVLCDFYGPYYNRFGQPKHEYDITRHVMRDLRTDKKFWLNLPLINRPDFEVALYCTSRVNRKAWNKQYIAKHGLPKAPLYQVYGYGNSKAPRIKGRVDVFIDDSVHNFIDLNKNGVRCILMDTPYNQYYDTPYRIYSLQLDEITKIYNTMVENGY